MSFPPPGARRGFAGANGATGVGGTMGVMAPDDVDDDTGDGNEPDRARLVLALGGDAEARAIAAELEAAIRLN